MCDERSGHVFIESLEKKLRLTIDTGRSFDPMSPIAYGNMIVNPLDVTQDDENSVLDVRIFSLNQYSICIITVEYYRQMPTNAGHLKFSI